MMNREMTQMSQIQNFDEDNDNKLTISSIIFCKY
jgi:hypothetical protein